MSLPSWERGLKLEKHFGLLFAYRSLPSWERGLKQYEVGKSYKTDKVAPLVGAWIETCLLKSKRCIELCRSPRGSVD